MVLELALWKLLGRVAAGPEFGQTLGNTLFHASVGGFVEDPAFEVGWEAFHLVEAAFEFVRVLVAFAVSPLFHRFCRRVAELHGDRLGDFGLGDFHSLLEGSVGCIGLRSTCEIDGDLGEGLVAFRGAQEVDGLLRGHGLFIGAELVRNRITKEPAVPEIDLIVEQMKERGFLLSTDGPLYNVLKIKPPIVFSKKNADNMVRNLDEVLNGFIK